MNKSYNYDGNDTLYAADQSEYQVHINLQRVLKTFPDESIPASIVILGVLVEEIKPVDGDFEHVLVEAKKLVDDPPIAHISSETVRAIQWLLKQVQPSLDADRKQLVGDFITNAGLNYPAQYKENIEEGSNEDASKIRNESCETATEIMQSSIAERKDSSESPTGGIDSASCNSIHDEADNTGCLICEFCGNAFSSAEELMSHLVGCSERPANATYECTICSSVFNSQFALDRHEEQTHASRARIDSTYSCDTCGQEFSSKPELLDHTTAHSLSDLRQHDTDDQVDSPDESQGGQPIQRGLIERNDTGIINHFDPEKGFGFITTGTVSDDVFFHISDFTGKTPSKTNEVKYDLYGTENGYKARNICHFSRNKSPFASTRKRWGNDEWTN